MDRPVLRISAYHFAQLVEKTLGALRGAKDANGLPIMGIACDVRAAVPHALASLQALCPDRKVVADGWEDASVAERGF